MIRIIVSTMLITMGVVVACLLYAVLIVFGEFEDYEEDMEDDD